MNANELADELEICKDHELPEYVHKTATMLRQQQAEIEALKLHNEGWKEDFIKQGIKLAKLKSELEIANAMLDSYEWCKK